MRVTIIVSSLAIMVAMILSLTRTMFYPKMLTRFCYNSQDPTRVTSQCIYCNYFSFDNTILGCTGSSAVSINMTATQAFCVIAQCLGQIRQLPVFLGRRKRSLNEDSDLMDGQTIEKKDYNKDRNEDEEEEGQDLVNNLDERSESERVGEEKEEELIRLIGMKKDGMEEITFELNGKREIFYVARQVDATLDDLPIEEDESFYSTKVNG